MLLTGKNKTERRVIKTDGEKCNGCGACADSCHEGDIAMAEGKDRCDGQGESLSVYPAWTISHEVKNADARVKGNCTDTKPKLNKKAICPGIKAKLTEAEEHGNKSIPAGQSELAQWPCQLRLAPVNAPYFDGAELLIAADCSAYAYSGFHSRFMRSKITLISCPKLDDTDYSDKLADVIANNDIKGIMIVRMEVACCGGLERCVKNAIVKSGKRIVFEVVTVSTDGRILDT